MKAARWYGLVWLWMIVMSTQASAVAGEPAFVPAISVYEQQDTSVDPAAASSVAQLMQRYDFKPEVIKIQQRL